MKLYTDMCETTVNVFENILKEIKCQRGDEELLIKSSIEQNIKEFLQSYKRPPDYISLGIKEYSYHPRNFIYVSSRGEIFKIETKMSDITNQILCIKRGQK